jgi:hypothetical protein
VVVQVEIIKAKAEIPILVMFMQSAEAAEDIKTIMAAVEAMEAELVHEMVELADLAQHKQVQLDLGMLAAQHSMVDLAVEDLEETLIIIEAAAVVAQEA